MNSLLTSRRFCRPLSGRKIKGRGKRGREEAKSLVLPSLDPSGETDTGAHPTHPLSIPREGGRQGERWDVGRGTVSQAPQVVLISSQAGE